MTVPREEETLAIVRANILNRVSEIEEVIADNGFEIAQKTDINITLEKTRDFYIEYYGLPFYEQLREYENDGQMRVFILRKQHAISEWLSLIGPENAGLVPALNHKKFPHVILYEIRKQTLYEPLSEVRRAKYYDERLRAVFVGNNPSISGFHGSANFIAAEREIAFFFPNHPRPSLNDEVTAYLREEINPLLLPALNELYRSKPKNPVASF